MPEKKDPEMELEGNLKLNQIRKKQFKKEKKQRNRKEKIALQLSEGLNMCSLNGNKSEEENYNFETDFEINK